MYDQSSGLTVDSVEASEPQDAAKQDGNGVDWMVSALVESAKQRDWQSLANAIDSSEVFVFGEPRSTDTLMSQLNDYFDDVCDLEIVFEPNEQVPLREDALRYSGSLRVIWSSGITWEEYALDLVFHLTVEKRRAEWLLTNLIVDRPLVAVSKVPPILAAAPGEMPDPVQTQNAMSDAEEAALYFAEEPHPEEPHPEEPSPQVHAQTDINIEGLSQLSTGGGKKHLVYVPILLGTDSLRDLLP